MLMVDMITDNGGIVLVSVYTEQCWCCYRLQGKVCGGGCFSVFWHFYTIQDVDTEYKQYRLFNQIEGGSGRSVVVVVVVEVVKTEE